MERLGALTYVDASALQAVTKTRRLTSAAIKGVNSLFCTSERMDSALVTGPTITGRGMEYVAQTGQTK